MARQDAEILEEIKQWVDEWYSQGSADCDCGAELYRIINKEAE